LIGEMESRRPDVVVLIDYPGFNLRFAREVKKRGIPVLYYISPQVWAWNSGRVRKMKGIVDLMLTVFPFETAIYKKEGVPVEFVGHPLLESIGSPQERSAFLKRYDLDPGKPVVGLLPGSRRQEIELIFPAMLGAARSLHNSCGAQILVGVASVLDREYMESFLRGDFPVQLTAAGRYMLFTAHDVPTHLHAPDHSLVRYVHDQTFRHEHSHDEEVASVGISMPGNVDGKRLNDWIGGLPIDEAMPMFFRMEPDRRRAPATEKSPPEQWQKLCETLTLLSPLRRCH